VRGARRHTCQSDDRQQGPFQTEFQNSKLEVEYKPENMGNSGLCLKGRYELQLLDDAGTPPDATGQWDGFLFPTAKK
jgi:hypothetical protein